MRSVAVLIAALGGLSSAALPTAMMEMPDEFRAQTTRISVSGFGGKNKGSYAFLDYSGDFKRGESRLGVFDPLYVSSKGKSSFTFRDSQDAATISAACEMTKKSVTVGIVTFDPKKMAYHCDFRSDKQLLEARFILGHAKASGLKESMLSREMRAGEASMFGQQLVMRSVHKYQGSKLQSPSPVGYFLWSGEQLVAAVELTDVNPTFFVLSDLADDLRQSVLVASLALSVLRDPANSALED